MVVDCGNAVNDIRKEGSSNDGATGSGCHYLFVGISLCKINDSSNGCLVMGSENL